MVESGSPRRPLIPAVIGVLAVALIAFCGWSLATYRQGSDPIAIVRGAALTTVEQAPSAVEESPSGSREAKEEDASPAAETAATEAGASASDAVPTASVTSSSASSDSGPAATASGREGSSDSTQTGAEQGLSVTVTVDARVADGGSSTSTVTLPAGSTAYDALLATGADVNASNGPLGVYVRGINGLAEKERGGESGWKYSVNGAYPKFSAALRRLADGDEVLWVYVTDARAGER